ncbi:MAG TPA: tripartite tricarboxylate transporter substrate binding protein [Burkholderiales bacterium]|jgi:tripartite-type tricarboxylate transporter receptor subunit TctC|nr:tripartite tricarboxylate transporter substrate binding protein [Burkholderiales bacterium]
MTALFAATAWAQSPQYPNRSIRLLVPNPPGGASDTIARIVAPGLSVALGQPVVVENRPGSNGNLSSELAAKAAPDGTTLLLGQDSQIVISPHLYPNLPVDTLKDLAPVATLITTQMVLTANPSVPAKDFREFLELAKTAKPPLLYASIGNGSQHHLTMEMLKLRAGIELVHVPYKGGGPATLALLAGDVPVMFGGNSVTSHIKAGKLRGLAVAGKKRSVAFPDLPTLSEFYPGLEVTAWLGVFAPAGVPGPVLSRLHDEINHLLASQDLRDRVQGVGGLEPFVSTREEFAALIRAEYAKYGEVVKATGAKID